MCIFHHSNLSLLMFPLKGSFSQLVICASGVFATDQKKTVPVKERKSVTLYTGVVNNVDLT